jgi:hypothetical protein
MGPRPEGGPTVTGAPYSAVRTTVTQQVLADGNAINRQEQTTIYRDSQGRTRTEMTIQRPGSQTPITRVTIFDPVAGVVHNLNVETATSIDSVMHRPPANASARPGPANRGPRPGGNAVNDTDSKRETLGTQMVAGISASGTRVTRSIAAGQMGNAQPIQVVHETWISEDLKVPVMSKSSDPRFGTVTSTLSNVNRSEPDPSLFQVPSGYTVKSAPAFGPGGHGGPRGGPIQ